tara:strand:+ start:40 stop:501 length:462 start_codon:yes stop_codon:yes gene_type:complete
MVSYKVPLFDYLRLTAKAYRKPLVALQNQQVIDGLVYFTNPRDIAILKCLINHLNTDMPMADTIGVGGVGIHINTDLDDNEYEGEDIRLYMELLDGYHMDGDWGRAKCPAHNGVGNTSLGVYMDTGQFGCKNGCSNSSVYAAIMALAREAGRV